MSSIAIVGTEETGKSVLLTCFAKKWEGNRSFPRIFAQDSKTAVWTDINWKKLTSGEWPNRTEAGSWDSLSWLVEITEKQTGSIRVVDVPGHDFRQVFARDFIDKNILTVQEDPAFSDQGKKLLAYLKLSSVIVLLINLDDFLHNEDQHRITMSEWSLMECAKLVASCPDKRVCISFSKMDKAAHSKLRSKEAIRAIFNTQLHRLKRVIRLHGIPIFTINAVSEVTRNGESHTRPVVDSNFPGLTHLFEWMFKSAAELVPIHDSIKAKGKNVIDARKKKMASLDLICKSILKDVDETNELFIPATIKSRTYIVGAYVVTAVVIGLIMLLIAPWSIAVAATLLFISAGAFFASFEGTVPDNTKRRALTLVSSVIENHKKKATLLQEITSLDEMITQEDHAGILGVVGAKSK